MNSSPARNIFILKMNFTNKNINFYSVFRLKPIYIFLYFLCVILFFSACHKTGNIAPKVCNDPHNKTRPNIILILADDIGYEIPTYTGGQSYTTPTIDSLANNGMQFNNCYSSPNCCPSRVMMLTGKYNFRNYSKWGTLNPSEKTIANMLQSNGYFTCVAGKWQLGGGDASVRAFGFDDYMLWNAYNEDITGQENDKGRYKNPKIYQNGSYLPQSQTQGKYADDMFADFISGFIDNHTQCPFFIYYPLSLCHKPFSPTPDDAAFASWNPENGISDISYFPSMVKYMDKKVKQIVDKVKQDSLENNTYIFFVGDNGTDSVTSLFNSRLITGGKGTCTEFGTHVPLIVSAPNNILSNTTHENLVDFTDFFSTIANIANIPQSSLSSFGILDGHSFYPQIQGNNSAERDWIYCYWKPSFGRATDLFKIYAQTQMYKLYDQSTNSNNFYNLRTDSLEQFPKSNQELTTTEATIKQQLQQVLDQMHN